MMMMVVGGGGDDGAGDGGDDDNDVVVQGIQGSTFLHFLIHHHWTFFFGQTNQFFWPDKSGLSKKLQMSVSRALPIGVNYACNRHRHHHP